jgi:hypothetical protein
MKAFVNQSPDRKAWGGTRQPAIARFDVSALSSCDEPVRRYFMHAIAHGAPLEPRMRLRMTGRIKVGLWLPFTAQQDCDGSSFIWRAQVPRHGRILTVTDSYDDGRAAIDGRLLGALRLFHSDNQDIVRSAAGRAAAEGILTPIGLLPSPTRIWRAESDNEITVDLALAPERPALHVTIDHDGAVQSIHLQRWGDAGEKAFGYMPSEETSSRRSDLATSSCQHGYESDGGTEPNDSARSLKPRSAAPCRTTPIDLTDVGN